MKKTLYQLFVALTVTALVLGGCSSATPSSSAAPTATTDTSTPLPPTATATATALPTATATATALPTDTPTPVPVQYGPDNFPSGVNPLTGLVVADPSRLARRPVAVKVNLVPRTSNRPPWGLSFADIVYDYYHNDGYTRLHAIFYSQDASLVGPVRSGRLPDSDLVQMYQSVFAYGSADIIINRILLNASYSNRLLLEGTRSDCPPTPAAPLCRFEPRGNDFLLGGTREISQHFTDIGVENGAQNLNGMYFYEMPPTNGTAASQAYVRYSGDNYIRWDYDPASGRYLRFQDNVFDQSEGKDEAYAPLTDRLNDQQIAADNVVIVIAQHQYYQQPPNEIVEVLLSGSGKAYALRDGKIYEVTWNRPTANSVLFLTFSDGTRYPFKPGTTWLQVIGANSVISQPQDNAWRFEFRFP